MDTQYMKYYSFNNSQNTQKKDQVPFHVIVKCIKKENIAVVILGSVTLDPHFQIQNCISSIIFLKQDL